MWLADLIVAAGRAVAERRQRRKVQAELMALDDHMLADIGLRRSQIAGIVYSDAGERHDRRPAASTTQALPARRRPA